MLNTQKLLYVLPDLAYVAELLPDKKPYTFAIQSFKQINGEFLNDTEFIAENIVKLVNKLEEGEEYFLILPDFLFTNTIISVKETSDAKIKETLSAETLPKLGLKEDTHLIETVVLNQLKGTTRVQLSAIEKSILTIFKVAISEKDIKIAGICPLSWAVKSLISLEPSISVLQMGGNLFTAQQYIGVDQATTASVDSPENIVETIKTLKGAESSIQTVYLCTNGIVEDKLKEQLSNILPLQQMATKDADAKIPSYVSQIITASMRTLNVPDWSVPTFKLTKATAEEKAQYASVITSTGESDTEDGETVDESDLPKPKVIAGTETAKAIEEVEEDEKETEPEELPAIEEIKESDKNETALPDIESAGQDEPTEETSQDSSIGIAAAAGGALAASAATAATIMPPSVIAAPTASVIGATALSADTTSSDSTSKDTVENEPSAVETNTDEDADDKAEPSQKIASQVVTPISTATITNTIEPDTTIAEKSDDDIDLSQFAQNGETTIKATPVAKPIIKNKSGVKNMMKMILITTGVFILTVAIGIGVGLAILKYSGSDKTPETPVVEVEEPVSTPTPTPTPTPEASASATIDKKTFSILIVNATTKAGYAGQIGTKLKAADFTKVTGGNAKGEYEDKGNYIYLKKTDAALVKELSEASGLTLTEDDSAKTEDAQGQYDAVIVLAE
jgi:hypothetical protein